MNKVRKLILGSVLLCLSLTAGYLCMAWYYSKGFPLNTWINGVYCTGKTVEEVNLELLKSSNTVSVVIADGENKRYLLTNEDIGLKLDFTPVLAHYLTEQNSLIWGMRLGHRTDTLMEPQITYDEQALKTFWDQLPFVQKERETAPQISVVWTEAGYQLSDTTRNRLNEEKGYELLKKGLLNALQSDGLSEIVYLQQDAYEDCKRTQAQEAVLAQWEKLQAFQSLHIIYDMGDEQLTLDAAKLSQFLEREADGSFKEEDGSLSVSAQKVNAFIDELADEYDTYKKERTFQSTRGDTITIKKGSYGTLIDREKEKSYLYNALTKGVSEVHIPSYEREAYHRGKNDIGDTYIEIDMTEQKMYLYLDGECLVDTDIVTGNTSKRMGTPEGIYSVYSMQRNRILRGPGYASAVKYWMPVNGNIGIHDASWRSSFGGTIYKNSGSHGCINTPYEAVKQIYENIEIGIPVIMFY